MKITRRIVQFAFLALVLGGVFVWGANAERWCPFGGVEAAYAYLGEGNMLCSLGVSNFYILGGVLLATLLLRRAFCGYVCPIGTLSEWLAAAGRRLKLPALRVEGRLDRALGLLKYAVLALILALTWRAGELIFRGFDPCYALIGRHGADVTPWTYVAAGAVVVASLAVMLPFCRWLCPLAAVLNPISRFGLARVKRDAASCPGCGRCAEACPMAIPVDRLAQVTAARCLSCLNCVEACPQGSSGALCWGPPERLGRRWPQAVLVAVLLACIGGAVAASYAVPLASFVKTNGVAPPARTAVLDLRIENLSCRGRANYLFWFLERDDEYRLPGHLRLEAWPGPGMADARITYDPAQTGEEAIRRAITEPYFDGQGDFWRHSPFAIEGYDLLAP